jgi:ribonucleotide reductase, class II
VNITVDLSNVRPAGEKLKGFGGVANPVRLADLYGRAAEILNRALGRQLTPVECCLLIDEAAACVVAGNIRRSAGMRQGDSEDTAFATAKDNLWQQGEDGGWRIDPDRDALRMANHTRVFHHKPSHQECVDAVRKQFYSGEGAIQYAPEAIARASADLLPTTELKQAFIAAYESGSGAQYLQTLAPGMGTVELQHRLGRYGLNPCGEIIGEDFHCNLAEVHLNQIDPTDRAAQTAAFTAGALSVAALLNHQFQEPRYQQSRLMDPIVGVSFTGLFDFFVQAFGTDWLKWWEAGRPDTVSGLQYKNQEQEYLSSWKQTVHDVVGEYCDRHGLKRPNRCTTVQPAGTKSLLTGASSGWHPPKAARYIRRITFRKNDPIALACLDYGYSVVPSQSDKDDTGNLLNDPFDARCTEWLVEIPVEVSWACLPGADQIAIEQFSALAQFDFYMQVQKFYTAHNTSATIELREDEIDGLADRIYQSVASNEGYMSAALLARFDAPFPRLPFEKIDQATFAQLQAEVLARRKTDDFYGALSRYDSGETLAEGPAGCDSDKCLAPEKKG